MEWRRSRSPVPTREKRASRGRGVLFPHGLLGFPPELSDVDECGARAPAIVRLLRPPRGGFDGGDLRCGEADGIDSEERWRDRLLLLASQTQKRCRRLDERGLERPGLFYESLRYR